MSWKKFWKHIEDSVGNLPEEVKKGAEETWNVINKGGVSDANSDEDNQRGNDTPDNGTNIHVYEGAHVHVHGGGMGPGLGDWFKKHVSKPAGDAEDGLHDKTGGVL